VNETLNLGLNQRAHVSLGKNSSSRQKTYRDLFACQIDGELLDEIRANTHKGMAVGNDRFKTELEKLT